MKQNPCPNEKMINIKPLTVCIGEPRTQKTNTILRSVKHINDVFYFPAERICSDMFLQLIATESVESVNVSGSVREYIDMLHTIVRFPKMAMERRSPRDVEFGIHAADMLVKHIVGDNVYLENIDTGKIEIIAEKTSEVIDISSIASSTKAFFGLILYLRYVAKEGDTIVIEEPESNLHPTQQAMLSEFFAILVNYGINVVMSTNSPYIIELLESQIESATFENKTELVKKFLLHNKNACINIEKVACYGFTTSGIENILSSEGYINWNTFCVIANLISDITTYVVYGYENKDDEDDYEDN